MKKNDRVTLRIERLGAEAEGVAKLDGMVVFVPFALPGETVEALIVSVKKQFAFAKVNRVLSPSPMREAAPCISYGRCGGCTCQHMQYSQSLEFKRQMVADCFLKIAKLDIEASSTIGMPNPWRYRNKTAIPIRLLDGIPAAGFYAPRSHRLIRIDDCPISMPQSSVVQAAVLEWMQREHIVPYDEQSATGIVRHIVSRTNANGESMVMLVVNSDRLPCSDSFCAALKNSAANVVTAAYCVNKKQDNTILGESTHVLFGSGYLHETMLGLTFRISPLSFFQVNTAQAALLYEKAIALCRLTGEETVADIYCGTGTISLCFARHVRRVTGIEVVKPAIDDAWQNARLNGIDNVDFVCARAEDHLPTMVQNGYRPDVVVLDPPRKGAAPEVLRAISECGVPKVLYISCHPATQARDAAYLVHEAGYTVTACQPVDMFCQTADVENIILLEK